MSNKLLKSGYVEKQVREELVMCIRLQSGFRKNWCRRFLELHEAEIKWYIEEGDTCDGYISLKDIQTVEEAEFSIEKPLCLSITLV